MCSIPSFLCSKYLRGLFFFRKINKSICTSINICHTSKMLLLFFIEVKTQKVISSTNCLIDGLKGRCSHITAFCYWYYGDWIVMCLVSCRKLTFNILILAKVVMLWMTKLSDWCICRFHSCYCIAVSYHSETSWNLYLTYSKSHLGSIKFFYILKNQEIRCLYISLLWNQKQMQQQPFWNFDMQCSKG